MKKQAGSFVKYSISSVVCFLLDYGLFTLLNAYLLRGMADGTRELAATYGARIVSAAVNFLLNRNLVFSETYPSLFTRSIKSIRLRCTSIGTFSFL